MSAVPRLPLPQLTPDQVVALFDALLSNADALLNAAALLLERDDVALARSLAILGLEESGKAIALHERRVAIAHAPEGEPFVDERLALLWSSHARKLEAVFAFLREDQYWFGTGPSEPTADLVLNTIRDWANEKNQHKQHGFYVDVDASGVIHAPQDAVERDAVADVLDRVHQIGWQLRLGQHIEAKSQADYARAGEPASEDEIRTSAELYTDAGLAPEEIADIIDGMRQGVPGHELHNDGYRYLLRGPGSSPFENVGKPGYEAQDRELWRIWMERFGVDQREEDGAD